MLNNITGLIGGVQESLFVRYFTQFFVGGKSLDKLRDNLSHCDAIHIGGVPAFLNRSGVIAYSIHSLIDCPVVSR